MVKVYSPEEAMTTPVTVTRNLRFSGRASDCSGTTGSVRYFQGPGSLTAITCYPPSVHKCITFIKLKSTVLHSGSYDLNYAEANMSLWFKKLMIP